MNEQDQITSGEPSASSSAESEGKELSYDTYKRVVGEAKKAKDRARSAEQGLEELRQQLSSYEDQVINSSKDKDSVIKALREKLQKVEHEKEESKLRQSLMSKKNAIRQEAVMQGCINPDALLRLIDKSQVDAVDFDGYEVNSDDVRDLVHNAKQKFSDINLFKTESIKIHDAPVVSKPIEPTLNDKEYSGMSTDELMAELAKLKQLG